MITSKKNINKRIRLNKNQISDIVFCFLLKTTFVAYFIQIHEYLKPFFIFVCRVYCKHQFQNKN